MSLSSGHAPEDPQLAPSSVATGWPDTTDGSEPAVRVLALETEAPGATAEAFVTLARGEAIALWALVQAGVVRETYFRTDRAHAVLVLECRDLDEARDHLATLPMVRAGLIGFEVVGLRPYPGFARLFADPDPPGHRGTRES